MGVLKFWCTTCGGIWSERDSILILNDSAVSSNSDMGIVSTGILTLSNSIVSDHPNNGIQNRCWELHNCRATLINSKVSGNSGWQGGIYNLGGTLIVSDSVVSGNTATVKGGGVYNNSNGTAILIDTTIAGNTVSSSMTETAVLSSPSAAMNESGSITRRTTEQLTSPSFH